MDSKETTSAEEKIKAYFIKCREILPYDYDITEEETEEIAQLCRSLHQQSQEKDEALEKIVYFQCNCTPEICTCADEMTKIAEQALNIEFSPH